MFVIFVFVIPPVGYCNPVSGVLLGKMAQIKELIQIRKSKSLLERIDAFRRTVDNKQ